MTHTASSHNFTLGQTVRNFGLLATIIAFHPVTGDLILQDAQGRRWVADAAKCVAVSGARRYKGGFVVFG